MERTPSKRTPGSRVQDFARIGLGAIFLRIDPDFRDNLVRQCLLGRERASPKAREGLNKAINDAVYMDGFRNASMAPSAMLLHQVLDLVISRSDLAGAVLRVWVESQEPLREEITAHLDACGVVTKEFDFPGDSIPMDFDDFALLEARRSYLESHPDSDAEEVSLLIQLIAGKLAFDDELEDEESNFVETLLGNTFEELDLLPPHAPEWETAVPEFLEQLTALMGAKEQNRNQAATLDREFAAIREQYAELIQFFQWNASRWATANLEYAGELPVAYDRAVELKELLSRYAPVHERAPAAPEELERATLRIELMPRMLEHGRALDEMMESGDDWDDDEFEPARLPDGGSGAGPVDNGPSPENPPDPDSEHGATTIRRLYRRGDREARKAPTSINSGNLRPAPSSTICCCGWKTGNWNRKTTIWTWKSNPSRSSCSKAAAREKASSLPWPLRATTPVPGKAPRRLMT